MSLKSLKRKGFIAGAAVGAGVAAAALAGAGVRWPIASAADQQPAVIKTAAPVFAPPPGAPLSFADIFEKVAPAVVSIDVTTHPQARQGIQIPGFEGFPFNFGPNGPQGRGGEDEEDEDGGGGGGGGQPSRPEAQATGSGFFISSSGYIVTNNHVVENADSITVRMTDQTELKAKLVGRDEGTDLAVIKVEGTKPFPYVDFEKQAKPRVGDWVVAVGNPFNLGGTATAGIISAYGRDIGEQFVDYIQIDAPINRGNSGGPTFDVYGRVIGVNTAIFSPSGGSVGIGFAVPADLADTITKQLIESGKVTRGYLGVTIQNVTPEIADSLNIAQRKGALVNDVVPNGPAQKGGVLQGDVVVSVNGREVTSNTDLTRQVALAKAGDILRLGIIRDGKPRTLEVRSGLRPTEAQLASNDRDGGDEQGQGGSPRAPAAATNVLGLGLVPLTEQTRNRLGVRPNVQGVGIDSVASGSDAAKKTIRRGDVLVKVGETNVTTPAQAQAAVAAAKATKRPSVLVLINRGGRSIFLPLKLEETPAN
jgi:serine protease Do